MGLELTLTILQGQKAAILISHVSFIMTMNELVPGTSLIWYLTHCSPTFRFVTLFVRLVLNYKQQINIIDTGKMVCPKMPLSADFKGLTKLYNIIHACLRIKQMHTVCNYICIYWCTDLNCQLLHTLHIQNSQKNVSYIWNYFGFVSSLIKGRLLTIKTLAIHRILLNNHSQDNTSEQSYQQSCYTASYSPVSCVPVYHSQPMVPKINNTSSSCSWLRPKIFLDDNVLKED